jgi:hypothetical protein
MSFLKKLFSPPPSNYGRFYTFSVKCKRCSEIIEGQVNLNNEPSLDFDEKGKPYYICRKVLVGNQQCFQQIEVVFKFNEQRGMLDRQITGGEFVEG